VRPSEHRFTLEIRRDPLLRSEVAAVTDSLLLYSFSLGLVAAFNPCGFPLLPAYLMLSAGEAGSTPAAARIVRSLVAGLCMTVGFIVVFGGLELAVSLGLHLTEGWLPWVMIPVGAACALYGLVTLLGRGTGLRLPLPRVPKGRGTAATFTVFGIGFAVASLGCALPLFVAGVVGVFGQHGTGEGLVSGLAYAVGMGLVVTCVSLAGAGARQVRLGRIRAMEPVLSRLAGAVLVLIGVYLVIYWVNDLVSLSHTPVVVRYVERVQTDIENFLLASPRLTGLVVGVIVITALTLAALYTASAERSEPRPPAAPAAPEPPRRARAERAEPPTAASPRDPALPTTWTS
jgi:cytochrome c-type biogenesis protein